MHRVGYQRRRMPQNACHELEYDKSHIDETSHQRDAVYLPPADKLGAVRRLFRSHVCHQQKTLGVQYLLAVDFGLYLFRTEDMRYPSVAIYKECRAESAHVLAPVHRFLAPHAHKLL